MTKYLIIALFSFALSSGCNGQKAAFTTTGANYFGDKIQADNAVALAEAALPETAQDTLDVLIKGTINEVCQAKGCWMTFESNSKDASVFVKFKDYGFFVPKDAGGKEAVVKGKLFSTITSVDELRHYAEDKGQSAEEIAAITEPQQELRMTAEGVLIYND